MQHAPLPRRISKKLLLTASAIGDAFDLLTLGGGLGIANGVLWVFIDVPVTVLHFLYAGRRAWVVLAEYVPGLGYLPCYTLAALTYPDKDQVEPKVIDVSARRA